MARIAGTGVLDAPNDITPAVTLLPGEKLAFRVVGDYDGDATLMYRATSADPWTAARLPQAPGSLSQIPADSYATAVFPGLISGEYAVQAWGGTSGSTAVTFLID